MLAKVGVVSLFIHFNNSFSVRCNKNYLKHQLILHQVTWSQCATPAVGVWTSSLIILRMKRLYQHLLLLVDAWHIRRFLIVLAREHKARGFYVLIALADSNGGKDSGADYKPHWKSYRSCFQFSFLTLHCLFPCNTVTSDSIRGFSFPQSHSNKL